MQYATGLASLKAVCNRRNRRGKCGRKSKDKHTCNAHAEGRAPGGAGWHVALPPSSVVPTQTPGDGRTSYVFVVCVYSVCPFSYLRPLPSGTKSPTSLSELPSGMSIGEATHAHRSRTAACGARAQCPTSQRSWTQLAATRGAHRFWTPRHHRGRPCPRAGADATRASPFPQIFAHRGRVACTCRHAREPLKQAL
jgi:hypothetical protein